MGVQVHLESADETGLRSAWWSGCVGFQTRSLHLKTVSSPAASGPMKLASVATEQRTLIGER